MDQRNDRQGKGICHVGGPAGRDTAARQSHQRRRCRGELPQQREPIVGIRRFEGRYRCGQRRLKANQATRSLLDTPGLFVARVRRVVGRDDIDTVRPDRLKHCLHIVDAA